MTVAATESLIIVMTMAKEANYDHLVVIAKFGQ